MDTQAQSGFLTRIGGQLRSADEVRDAVYLTTGDTAAKQSRFWLLLIISAVIASAGVIGDSTATVIGAMIVAPLAIPIQGIAVALAGGELRALAASASILLLAVVVVIGIGALAGMILPELKPADTNGQITGRVSPTLIDLVAAAATGLAGSLAIARRDIADILPGVAIAISLVPPLAVVGITAAAGDWDGALGALLLFTTNVLAIIVVGGILFSLIGLLPAQTGTPRMDLRPIYSVVAVAGVLVTAALAVATTRAVQLQTQLSASKDAAARWAAGNGENVVNVHYEGDELIVVVEGRSDGSADAALLDVLDGAVPRGTSVELNRVPGVRRRLGNVQ